MTGNVVEVAGLSKRYRSLLRPAVDAIIDVDLAIEGDGAGQIHGIIGPNGSGKTTFLRCLLGLVRPSTGSARVFGIESSRADSRVGARIGSLLDEPSFFPPFSGRRNLQLLAELHGIPRGDVASVLERVGLTDRADDPFKTYSRGMRQRLGIAGVMLRRPHLVLLDEPTNGLDPLASRQMWSALSTMALEGATVLVSSHQLADLERGCTHAIIFNRGRVVDRGTVAEVTTRFGDQLVVVEVGLVEEAIRVLHDAGCHVIECNGQSLTVDAGGRGAEDVNRALAEHRIFARGLMQRRPSLEESFVRLTQHHPDEPPQPMPEGMTHR